MVEYELTIGQEELDMLRSLAMDAPVNVKRRTFFKIVYVIMAVGLVGLGIYCRDDLISCIGCFLLAAVALVMTFGGMERIQRGQMRRVQNQANSQFTSGTRTFTFQKKGVTVSSSKGSAQVAWDQIVHWGERDHYLYLRRIDQALILVDKNKLPPEQLQTLYGLIEQAGLKKYR